MADILIAWELGGNLGHLRTWRPLIAAWQAAGHRIALAVRDLAHLHRSYPDHGIDFYQAPFQHGVRMRHPRVTRLTQILDNIGFHDTAGLLGRCRAWRGLYAAIQPDLVVFDHSPTALLAARGLEFRRATWGNGFFLPPPTLPWPDLGEAAARGEPPEAGPLLERANRVVEALSGTALATLADLYATDADWLCTYPELDPYRESRGDVAYCGTFGMGSESDFEPHWPNAGDERLFAYLKPGPGTAQLLSALARTGCRVLAYVPGVDPTQAGGLPENLRLLSGPADYRRVMPESRVVVCNANHATCCEALLAGTPLLMLPTALESKAHARGVEALGAGLVVSPGAPAQVTASVRRLLDEPGFATAARGFAARHSDRQAPLARVLTRAERLLAA